jgi:predicted DNA binding protein
MAVVEICITQTDCPHVSVTERYRSLYILIMNTQYLNDMQNMFSVFYCTNQEELELAISYFSRHRLIKDFTLLSKKKGIATAYYRLIPTSMFRRMDPRGFRIHPVVVHAGIEKWLFITGANQVIDASDINDRYTKVVSIRKLNQEEFLSSYPGVFSELHLTEVLNGMSDMDLNLLKAALKYGYFSWPRNTNLSELSRKLKISKSTLSYHFRNIERRLVNAFSANFES